MTTKAAFSEDEWTRLKRGPFIAGLAISLADPGGPIEAIKETAATLKTVTGAADAGAPGELVGALAEEVTAEARARSTASSARRRRPRRPTRTAAGCWPPRARRPTRRRRAASSASTRSA